MSREQRERMLNEENCKQRKPISSSSSRRIHNTIDKYSCVIFSSLGFLSVAVDVYKQYTLLSVFYNALTTVDCYLYLQLLELCVCTARVSVKLKIRHCQQHKNETYSKNKNRRKIKQTRKLRRERKNEK